MHAHKELIISVQYLVACTMGMSYITIEMLTVLTDQVQ